ncbi:NADH:flavin oxidoreductase [Gordonia terrae]|uniref:NADH:flavin oxidoreductase n=2 Tax=Gordonia terrae TaxID=2055 RepID=A0AAD0K8T0_9ACTN|nr:NADH:flavin oxidoreductase [Gordonia terrae]VTR09619.1 NADH:flavin oxidoreductase [Clostridioides difficile]ANY22230.1 oxidoreductase [Gordonia terrae]AWO82969.1 NADH:flavin oxidoreductase [Gordonia terrae]VTS30131.1 NADH oxidase [Gordonia terrae]GAB46301.1 putative oxidoreductase [Gordonia terrae NBRC 100016]
MSAHPDVLSPARLGPVQLRNRTLKAATYENMARNGLVTDPLIDFHVEHARGGVGMTTVAYCAVSPDGRIDQHQILWRPEARPGLQRLTDAVHAVGAAISAQIGHSGPVNNGKETQTKPLAPSRYFNMQFLRTVGAASTEDLERVIRAHGEAATMAIETGFDAVEVHLGHNYLASSFLSPNLNRRTDEYGGSLANRARLGLRILDAVREAAQDRLGIVVKLNMDDGVPGGFWIDEAMQVAQWIESAGSADALEMTAGSSLLNPMYLFKGDAPIHDFAAAMPQPIRAGIKLVGKHVLHEYPYVDGYLMQDAKQIRSAVSMPMILLGGVTNRATMDDAMKSGFDFVAMGRALLREPDLINRIAADPETTSLCNHNNKCMVSIFTSTRCVLRSPHPADVPSATG